MRLIAAPVPASTISRLACAGAAPPPGGDSQLNCTTTKMFRRMGVPPRRALDRHEITLRLAGKSGEVSRAMHVQRSRTTPGFLNGRDDVSPFGGNCLRPLWPFGGQVFEQEAQLDGVLVVEFGVGGEGAVAGVGEDGLEGGDEGLK